MSEIIQLSNVRLSFPTLVTPRAAVEGGVLKYSADFLLDPADMQPFMQQAGVISQAKWGEHAGNVLQMIQGDRKLRCFGQGSERIDKKTFKPYVGYEGKAYISANTDKPVVMVDATGKPIDTANTMASQAAARKLYGGCYVNAAVRPWVQDNKHGRAIRCELIAIQFFKDGEAFGLGEPDVSNLFGAVAAPAAGSGESTNNPIPSFLSFPQ